MIPFAKPDITNIETMKAGKTLASGWITQGPKVREFAGKVAEIVGADHAVCYDSCTAAMEMSLRVLGIGEGDEVITTPYTYSATAEVIRNVGARIVFCDLKKDSFEMDYDRMGSLISERTKAVIPVDYGGIPCDYDKIKDVLSGHRDVFAPKNELQESIGRIAIVADAAHSFGASYKDVPVGRVADFTCFSFHVLKPITTGGEGGAVTWKNFDGINNDRLARILALYGDHGQTGKNISNTPGKEWEYDIELFGYNHIMTDVDASVGLGQLERVQELKDKRAAVAEGYYKGLPERIKPGLFHFGGDYKSSMHLFPVRILEVGEHGRNAVFSKMQQAGISCNVHYKPLPMFTAYRNAGFKIEDYPEAYNMYSNLITLPFHTFMKQEDVDEVCKELRKAVDSL